MNPYSLESTFGPACWVTTGILIFFLLEWLIPFRLATLSKLRRWRINFSLNLSNVVIVDLCFVYLLRQTGFFSEPLNWDIFNTYYIPSAGRIVMTILALDLVMYFWHRMNHGIPFFWLFHRVHHTDLDVDVSSASRFHFGEVTISTILTYTFMLVAGANIVEVRIFQVVLFLMAQFGHSNIQLPQRLENFLWLIIVPPSMHRIHHSDKPEETDSNYGTIFSFWDRIFGTMKREVDQKEINFGLKEFSNPRELSLRALLGLPFRGLLRRTNRSSRKQNQIVKEEGVSHA